MMRKLGCDSDSPELFWNVWHFTANGVSIEGWTLSLIGTGSSGTIGGEPDHPGVNRILASNFAAADESTYRRRINAFDFGAGFVRASIAGIVRPVSVPTAVEDFVGFSGLLNANNESTSTRRLGFQTSFALGANWQIATQDGGGVTFVDTLVPVVALRWYVYRIDIDANGTVANAFLAPWVNATAFPTLVQVGSVTPPVGGPLGSSASIRKLAGVTQRNFDIDLLAEGYELPPTLLV